MELDEIAGELKELQRLRRQGILTPREAFLRHEALLRDSGLESEAFAAPSRPAIVVGQPLGAAVLVTPPPFSAATAPAPRGSAGVVRAGFGERVGAAAIDVSIMGLICILLTSFVPFSVAVVLVAVLLAIPALAYFWTVYGATPGKMVAGLRVVNAATGGPIDLPSAIVRYGGYVLSLLPLGLGFLAILWDEHGDAWHDKIAETRVIKVQE